MRRVLLGLIVLTILALAAVFYVGHRYFDLPVAGLFAAAVGGGLGVLLMRRLGTRR